MQNSNEASVSTTSIYIQARLPIPSDMTQIQSETKRPDDSLYVRHLEDLTKLGINVDEVSTS